MRDTAAHGALLHSRKRGGGTALASGRPRCVVPKIIVASSRRLAWEIRVSQRACAEGSRSIDVFRVDASQGLPALCLPRSGCARSQSGYRGAYARIINLLRG
jgi:hypothetical protein